MDSLLEVKAKPKEAMGSENTGDSDDSKESQSNHVSIVYFHGMGSQRRHEEVSRLIDSLDTYAGHSAENPEVNVGFLSKIRPRIEQLRNNDNADITYIRLLHRNDPEAPWGEAVSCRFYEVYWAPVMAAHSSIREILIWLFSNIFRPWQTIRSKWRDRQRLRRASLFRLMERTQDWPGECRSKDFLKVFRAYDKFEGARARRDYELGTFTQFQSFLGELYKRKPNTVKRLQTLSVSWRKAYYRQELRNSFFLITLGLTLVLFVILAICLILMVLQLLAGTDLPSKLDALGLEELKKALQPKFMNALPLLMAVASLVGLTRFLTKYLGDVELWTTYEETNEKYEKRKEVIRRGVELLSHVLSDENCNRVVVVGHSLGTAVAQDTLLELARYNRARNRENPMAGPLPLEKIQHFVTLASPIDKIQYLFESYSSRHHRYNRVVEEIRGDIGEAPFSKNGKPHIHWINYWDEGDIISGSLQSPSNRRWFSLRVDNVHTSNFHFPDPGRSHTAYFENREVIKNLYNIFFKDQYNFKDASLIPKEGYDYESKLLGTGKFYKSPRRYLVLLLVVPYLLLVNIIVNLVDLPSWAGLVRQIAGGALGIVLFVLLMGFLFNKVHGHRNPL